MKPTTNNIAAAHCHHGRIPNSAVTKAFNQLEIMGESYDRSDFTYDPVTL